MDKSVIISTQSLVKYFHDPVSFQALKGIDINIYEGQFASIVGSSGSGKSTLLYVLSTLDGEYEGKIIFDQVELKSLNNNGLAELRNSKIGFVFQFHYLLPEFSVLENVMLPAMRNGRYSREEIEERAYNKLKILGLQDQALKKASRLSGGQQQRVAIARALINDPKIIFGDEPTGNLDSKNTQMVFGLFKELKQEFNQTILVVTHDDKFASKTDRIITLLDGQVIRDEINN